MFRYLAIALFIVATVARAEDWPRFRGPGNNGISKETGLLKAWPTGGPKVAWTAPIGTGFSSMSVAGGRVYTMYQDGEGQFVTALDEKTGKPAWPAPVRTGDVFIDRRDGYHGPRSTPTVDGGRVYALDANGVAVCLNAADGKLVWSKNILGLTGGANNKWGMAQSPFIYGNNVIFISGGDCRSLFIALNKTTGETVWKSGSGIGAYNTPVISRAGGVEQLVFVTGTELTGIRPADGKILWTYPWRSTNDLNAISPVVMDDKVFVSGGYYHGTAAVKLDMTKPNPAAELWESRDLMCYVQLPVLVGNCLYGYSMGTGTCIDTDGKLKWQDEEGKLPPRAQLIYADGLFYIWGENGAFAVARMNPAGAQLLGSIELGSGSHNWGVPSLANGRFYARDERQIYCIDVTAK